MKWLLIVLISLAAALSLAQTVKADAITCNGTSHAKCVGTGVGDNMTCVPSYGWCVIYGQGGRDNIYGGTSPHGDELNGNAGADELYGESGVDLMDGGGDNDFSSSTGRFQIIDCTYEDYFIGGSGFDEAFYWAHAGFGNKFSSIEDPIRGGSC